jgi:hypothetical protein
MASVLEIVEHGIDALAAVDPDTLTDAELHEITVASQRLRDRLAAAAAPVVARWDARAVWTDNGARTAGTRLAVESGSSKGGADAVVRRARALIDMPATLAAAQAGDISIDVVDAVIAANTPQRRDVFAELEAELIESLRGLRYRQAVRAVRYWCARADALLGLDGQQAASDRDGARLYASATFDGNVELSGRLEPVGGAIVTGELDRLIEQLGAADAEAGVERTPAQLRAAALVEMARRSAAMPGDARFSRPLYTVVARRRAGSATSASSPTAPSSPRTTSRPPDRRHVRGRPVRRPQHGPCRSRTSGSSPARSAEGDRGSRPALPAPLRVRRARRPLRRRPHHARLAASGPTSQGNGRLECKPPTTATLVKHDHGATAPPRPTRST